MNEVKPFLKFNNCKELEELTNEMSRFFSIGTNEFYPVAFNTDGNVLYKDVFRANGAILYDVQSFFGDDYTESSIQNAPELIISTARKFKENITPQYALWRNHPGTDKPSIAAVIGYKHSYSPLRNVLLCYFSPE